MHQNKLKRLRLSNGAKYCKRRKMKSSKHHHACFAWIRKKRNTTQTVQTVCLTPFKRLLHTVYTRLSIIAHFWDHILDLHPSTPHALPHPPSNGSPPDTSVASDTGEGREDPPAPSTDISVESSHPSRHRRVQHVSHRRHRRLRADQHEPHLHPIKARYGCRFVPVRGTGR